MWRRFGLSIVTIILYIFISSVVIVLAQGYTVDLQNKRILTTGLVEIDTFPHGAQILLNGIDTKKASPAGLSHYLPGTYAVSVNYPGYEPVTFPVDIVSELVTHIDELAFFPEQNNWRNLQLSAPIQNIKAFTDNQMFFVETSKSLSWWNIQNKRLVKIFDFPTGKRSSYSCLLQGNVCVVINDDQAYLVDITQGIKKLQGMPVFSNDRSLYKFHDDYLIFVKDGDNLLMQKISKEGVINTQTFEEGIDTFTVYDQNVWFVKNHDLWRQSLISGLSQKVTALDDQSGKVEKLFITSDYAIWQKDSGETVLFDIGLEAVINSWNKAQIFDYGLAGIVVVQDAKIWLVSNEKGLLFLGQANNTVSTVMPYSKMEWVAQLQDGNHVLVLVEPVRILPISSQYVGLSVVPYKGMIAQTKQVDTLLYHVFPEQSWMGRIMSN